MSAYDNTSAAGQARQHNGNNYNYQTNYYPPKQRQSDEKLRERARNRALLQAAAEGQTIRTNKLLKDGADVDYVDKYGWTALHHAAYSGFEDTASALLAAGADVNARSEHFGTPLALAALKGRFDVAETLLNSRASVKAPCGKLGSIAHASCAGGNVTLVEKLLEHGADMDKVAEIDAGIIATLLGTQDVGNYLDFEEALERAPTLEWEDDMVQLEYDSRIKMPVKYCTAAVNIAALYTHLEIVRLLARPTVCSTIWQYMDRTYGVPLYLSAFGKVSTLRSLLEYHKEFYLPKKYGSLFMSAAAYAGNHECLKHLLQSGLPPYPNNPKCMTPLLWAARRGHAQCVELLMQHKDPDKDWAHSRYYGTTPLMDAAWHGHLDCVRVLLRNGASLEPLQRPRANALHYAAYCANIEIIQELVEAGIDINSLDERGQTPLFWSLDVLESKCGQVFRPPRNLVEKLISLGADPSINNIAQRLKDDGWEDVLPWLEKK